MPAALVNPPPSPAFPGRTLLESEEGLDPRVKRTRHLLRRALVALLAEKGFEEISVQDLAERATVNRVTFYDHFADKYALLDSLIGENFRELLHLRIAEEGTGCCREGLTPLFLALCDYLAKLSSCCKKEVKAHPLFAALVESRIKALLCELLRARLEKEAPPDASASPRPSGPPWRAGRSTAPRSNGARGERPVPPEILAAQVLPALAAALYND